MHEVMSSKEVDLHFNYELNAKNTIDRKYFVLRFSFFMANNPWLTTLAIQLYMNK